MPFDLPTWKEQTAERWRDWSANLPATVQRLGVKSAYGLLAVSAWLPLVAAATSQDPGPAISTLAMLTAGVGTNLISNIVQRKYDEATAARIIEAEVANDPKFRAELDAVLAEVEAVQAAQTNLGDNWAGFAAQLLNELKRIDSPCVRETIVNTGGGAYVGGDVTLDHHSEFVGGDKQVSQQNVTIKVEHGSGLKSSASPSTVGITEVRWGERDKEAVRYFEDNCEEWSNDDDELLEVLKRWSLVSHSERGVCFTSYGALLFGPRDRLPNGFHTDVQVSDERVQPPKMANLFGCSLLKLLKDLSGYLSPLWENEWEDPARRDGQNRPFRLVAYPKTAIIEALVNFVIHRDYSVNDLGVVIITNEYVRFMNPGTSPYDVYQLLNATDPLRPKYQRNPDIIKAIIQVNQSCLTTRPAA